MAGLAPDHLGVERHQIIILTPTTITTQTTNQEYSPVKILSRRVESWFWLNSRNQVKISYFIGWVVDTWSQRRNRKIPEIIDREVLYVIWIEIKILLIPYPNLWSQTKSKPRNAASLTPIPRRSLRLDLIKLEAIGVKKVIGKIADES